MFCSSLTINCNVRVGMGYDLYLRMIGFAKPTHIFQFYSTTVTNQNLPSLPEYVVSPTNQEPPKISFVEMIDNSGPSNRYPASDRRLLTFFSYFYSTSAMSVKQENEIGRASCRERM